MKSNDYRQKLVTLAISSALAGTMLSGCAGNPAPRADFSANQAQVAMESGKVAKAIDSAEAAVLAEPRNANYRAMLGAAYLDAGRFASAATSFDDAMQLGDRTPRTALSMALALSASGKNREAIGLLNEWEGQIAPSDLGLAFALAGQPQRGIHILSNAIRSGHNNAKVRQNLAYSYALAGRWREARLMTEQDIPAGEVSKRIGEWAQTVHPSKGQERIAGLLGVPVGTTDAGQPIQLALNNNPSAVQLAESAVDAGVPQVASRAAPAQAGRELPPLQAPGAPVAATPVAQPVNTTPVTSAQDFADAFPEAAPKGATVAAVAAETARFVSSPVVQQAMQPSAANVARPAASPAQVVRTDVPASNANPTVAAAAGSHLIQLGSFSSQKGAERAWGIYTKRYPELADREMVITEAVVRGKRYWRVSAGGYAKSSAASMCGTVKRSGHGCFAYHESRPLPGAVDRGVRMARR